MNGKFLELSQMLEQHPLLNAEMSDRVRYIKFLSYAVEKYAEKEEWANASLKLYTQKLLGEGPQFLSSNFDVQKDGKKVLATRFKPFCFWTHRYYFAIDSVFLCAYENKETGQLIFSEIEALSPKRAKQKLEVLFDYIYSDGITAQHDLPEGIEYFKKCWDENRVFLAGNPIKILITATMSAGKSTLINAIIGKKINRTQNEACTAKIHCIVDKAYEDGFVYKLDSGLNLDADQQTLMLDDEKNLSNWITVGTYFRTLGKPPRRLWLMDTPGVNSSQNKEHKQITEQAIQGIHPDLLILLLNGTSIGTEDERRHLLFLSQNYHGKTLFVVNKLDTFQKEEDSIPETLQLVREDLNCLGFEETMVVPVSAYAAYLAKIKLFGGTLNEDEEDDLGFLSRKMKRTEYQLDHYYPEFVQIRLERENEEEKLLLHSGILHLEHMIYNLGGKEQ